jgi:hypothetical protein
MSKHTPGPWTIVKDGFGRQLKSGSGISLMGDEQFYPWAPDEEADWLLIAAAPELLEALKDMLAGWRYIRETHGDLYGVGWDRAQQKAEAAIAKAEGV